MTTPHTSDVAKERAAALADLPLLAQRIGRDAAVRENERTLPFDGFELFRKSGLGRLRIPAEQGGLDGTLESLFETISAIAAEESNVAHALRIHFDMTESLRITPRSPFNDRQVTRVVEGAIFGGGSTEKGTAKPGQITTQLERDGDHFRLSGRKYYTTGTAFADFGRFNVLDADGGPVMIVVPVKREGIRVIDDWDGMGQRMTASGSIVFDKVAVRADEITVRGNATLSRRHGGALRQLHLVAVAGGIVRRIFRDAQHYVTNHGRAVLHSPAATAREDHFIQQVVGDLAAHTHAIDTLIRENARSLDRSSEAVRSNAPDAEALVLESALITAKTQLIVSKLALHAAEKLFEAGGASATSRIHNFDRHWRNLRTIFSHNPLLHKARIIGDYELNGITTHMTEGRVF